MVPQRRPPQPLCGAPLRPLLEALSRMPRLPALMGLLTVLLCLPALGHGWYGDDWFHLALLRNTGLFPQVSPVWNLFRFLGPGAPNDYLLNNGMMPWWADEAVRAAFFRPISALTHMADNALWPHNAALQHAHSLVWVGLGVGGMATAMGTMLGPDREGRPGLAPTAVALALLIFAVEDAHSTPAAWLANRNAFVAMALGSLALLAHLRWVRHGDKRWAPLAVGLAAVALCAAEAAMGALAWIVAWQLTCDRSPWSTRLVRLLPYTALVGAWRLFYDHFGYGASGSGLYVDPGAGVLQFLAVLTQRWPVLMSGLWAPLPIDVWAAFPLGTHWMLAVAGFAVVLVILAWSWPMLRRRDSVGDRARLLLLGAAGCLIPPSAAFPMDRVVGFAAAGSAALIALVFIQGPTSGPRRWMSQALLFLHLPVSAMLLVARVASLPAMGEIFGAGALGAPMDEALTGQTLVFANGTDFAAVYTPVQRQTSGVGPVPRRVALLAASLGTYSVTREDDHTLVYTAEDGFLNRCLELLFRDPAHPIPIDEPIRRADFTATVRTTTDDGRPRTVAFVFDVPLDDPSLRWVAFEGIDPLASPHLLPWTPPALGQVLTLEPALPIR